MKATILCKTYEILTEKISLDGTYERKRICKLTRHENSLLRRGFCFLKNRGKEGKAEKRERRKNGKGGKSAREREKQRKPLPDFCRNMAKVVDIRPHTT